jgi:phosphoribosyl-dephospho-CoA transferase
MHAASDLDLILRTPQPITRNPGAGGGLDQRLCRVDMQLQTPFGAVALREWAGGRVGCC